MIPDTLNLQLQDFCRKYGLIVSTQYRDSEVISVQIVDDQSTTYQLWLENSGVEWKVKGWDYKSRRTEHCEPLEKVNLALEKSYHDIMAWIAADQHTRTFV